MGTYPYPGPERAWIRCFHFSRTAWLSSPIQTPPLGSKQFGLFGTSIHPEYSIYTSSSTCLRSNSLVSCHIVCLSCVSQWHCHLLISCWSQALGILFTSLFLCTPSLYPHPPITNPQVLWIFASKIPLVCARPSTPTASWDGSSVSKAVFHIFFIYFFQEF